MIPFDGAQQCFLGEDGYIYCNAVNRGGKLYATDSGAWWKFPPRKRKKRVEKKTRRSSAESPT